VKPEPKKNYGLQVQESKAEKVQKLDNLLGGTFTATTDREVTDDDNPFLCVGWPLHTLLGEALSAN